MTTRPTCQLSGTVAAQPRAPAACAALPRAAVCPRASPVVLRFLAPLLLALPLGTFAGVPSLASPGAPAPRAARHGQQHEEERRARRRAPRRRRHAPCFAPFSRFCVFFLLRCALTPSLSRGAARITDADRAVLSLKTQRRKLAAQQRQLESDVTRETAAAKALAAAGKRDRALLALRCRAAKRKLLAQLEAYALHVETLLLELDAAARSADVLAALKEGTAALRAAAAATPAAAVEAMLGEHEEAVAAAAEIAASLAATPATSAGGAELGDEDALLQELRSLTGAQQAAPPGGDAAAAMPDVPTAPPHIAAATPQQAPAERERQAVLA